VKISRADIIPLKIPLEHPFYKPQPMETIFPVLVRLYVEGGLDSFGVCFTFARQKSLVACIEDLKDLVIGSDVMQSEETWQRLFQATRSMGHQGYPVYALSALILLSGDCGRPLRGSRWRGSLEVSGTGSLPMAATS
jgi:L-alanine-DL-glutamate epimerase-like enolase superfamily enzyme